MDYLEREYERGFVALSCNEDMQHDLRKQKMIDAIIFFESAVRLEMKQRAMPRASLQAVAAVRAIKHGREWCSYATRRYLERFGAFHHYVAAAHYEAMRRGNRRKL